jgi:hypothetical protein
VNSEWDERVLNRKQCLQKDNKQEVEQKQKRNINGDRKKKINQQIYKKIKHEKINCIERNHRNINNYRNIRHKFVEENKLYRRPEEKNKMVGETGHLLKQSNETTA